VGTGATDVGATLSSGATMTVSGTASSTYISAGGQVLVASGGLLTGASVDGAITGVADIYGSAVSNTLLSGSLQTIESGGVALATDITTSAATQVVSAGGSASGTLIRNGGVEVVYGSASNETVSSGGVVTVGAGGSVSGDTVLSGGEIFVAGGSATNLTLAQGALLDFSSVNYAAGETVTVSGGALEVLDSNGNVLASATLAGGTYTGASYTVTDDGAGHALVSVAICYLEGTQILTPKGEVKVEMLKAGDTVVTRFGGLQKIRWIGRQSFRGEAIKDDWKNIPVHIRAGALADNVPSRDLYVSPGHSMLVDGTLLLAKNLVNGITITQGWTPEQVEYYQLDLGAHDCVLAEGAWSETFADAGTLRDEFHNAADFTARFPNVRAPDAIALCAPRPEKGEALAKGLTPVLARAGLKSAGKLRGQVDKVHGGFMVEGWAQDLSNPDFPVTLEVLHDGVVLGDVIACDYRPDLQKAGIGRGYHAFSFVSPIRLTAEMHAGISVRRKSDGDSLGVNPEIQASRLPAVPIVATSENADSSGRVLSQTRQIQMVG
jgi:autotransporter passenger strand-loop-strand repeat protein